MTNLYRTVTVDGIRYRENLDTGETIELDEVER